MHRIKIYFFFLLALSFSNCFSQALHLSNNAKVSLITCGSGTEIYSLFGHTAIRIKDDEQHIDQVYNYGTFDFNTPNFYLKFVKGDLQYMASSDAFIDFMNQYLYEHRSVYEQVLNFSQEQKQLLFDSLNRALVSSERFYTYKFIDKNCTTMVLEVVNKTLGEKALIKVNNRAKTYRAILFPYFHDHFYENLGISIIFGKKVDMKGDRIFLPSDLYESARKAVHNGRPLCLSSNTLLEFATTKIPLSFWNNVYTLCLILGLIVMANNNKVYMIYFLLCGLLGLFFCFAGVYSLHKELATNYNILLFNPLLLLMVYFFLKNKRKGMFITSLVLIGSIIIYSFIMLNKIHLIIVVPFIITNLTGLIKLAILIRKKEPS